MSLNNKKKQELQQRQVSPLDMDDNTWLTVKADKNQNTAHVLHTRTEYAVFGKKQDDSLEQISECYSDSFGAATYMDQLKASYQSKQTEPPKKKWFAKHKQAKENIPENPYKVIGLQSREKVFWGTVWHSMDEEESDAIIEDEITNRRKTNFKQSYACFAPTIGQGTEDPFDGDYVQVTSEYNNPDQPRAEFEHLVANGTFTDYMHQDPVVLVRQTFETYGDWTPYKRIDMTPIAEYAAHNFHYIPDEPLSQSVLEYIDYQQPTT